MASGEVDFGDEQVSGGEGAQQKPASKAKLGKAKAAPRPEKGAMPPPAEVPERLQRFAAVNARIKIRRGGEPAPGGECVVYWMQRAQRGIDNHAVNIAVEIANALDLASGRLLCGHLKFSRREPAPLCLSTAGPAAT